MTTTPNQRKRKIPATPSSLVTEGEENALLTSGTVTQAEYSVKAPKSDVTVEMPTAPRISFDRGSQETDVQRRSKNPGAFEARGRTARVSEVRERIRGPISPGALPVAVIDEYGFVLPFCITNPMDKVILSQIPGITFVYSMEDYLMVKEHNEKMLMQRRFEDTLQGTKLRMPPEEEKHGFRNGREVVASFVDETMLNPQTVTEAFNYYSN